jgi:cytochrome c-type biogenesis protein CcmH
VPRRAILATLFALALAPAAPAAAPRASLPDVEDEVMCTVCGTPLNQSSSPQAERERVFIRRLIAQGQTKEQIKSALKDQYGPSVLALPQDSGFSLAAYLVPIALIAAALASLAFALPRWRRREREPAGAPAPVLSDADARRLDEDLARYD